MDNIDFDSVANELQHYTKLSHDEIVTGLKAMQQRDRRWKNHALFLVRLCGGKSARLTEKLKEILIDNKLFSRSYIYELLKAGKILINMQESEIEKIDCYIDEFLYKKGISKNITIYEITKLGQYELPWEESVMYIYSGSIGDLREGTWFLSHGDIKVKSVQFTTKEKRLDNKKTITTTTMLLDGIEYEIYKFDSNYKPWVYKVKDLK